MRYGSSAQTRSSSRRTPRAARTGSRRALSNRPASGAQCRSPTSWSTWPRSTKKSKSRSPPRTRRLFLLLDEVDELPGLVLRDLALLDHRGHDARLVALHDVQVRVDDGVEQVL